MICHIRRIWKTSERRIVPKKKYQRRIKLSRKAMRSLRKDKRI